MRNPALILAFVAVTCCASIANAESVDELVSKHIDAIGGAEAIRSVQNLVYSNGTYVEGEFSSDGNATMSRGRPYFKLVGDKNDPGSYMEGYDGAAWEWFADPGVVIKTVGAASEAGRHYAGVESPLFEYDQKGSMAELVGETEFDGRPVFTIRLTRLDGFVEHFYIDKESHMLLAASSDAPIHAFGEEVSTVTRHSDYRRVGGVLIAHAYESVQLPSGQTLSTMQWGRIEANRDLPDDWFTAPEYRRTPVQRFIEQLYEQRSDIEAVRWTYHLFRTRYPEVDTSEAVNFAGFHTLKMGDIDTATELLSWNVSDYPQSADAHFGLGRALESAGQEDDAREQFMAAISIDPEHARARDALIEAED